MRHNPNEPRFMSLPTVINWFFAWASRMKIDFRQRCSHCGDKSIILACDGTKIGMSFKNTFVRPIGTIENQVGDVLAIHRLNRCFLSNLQKCQKEVAARLAEARLNLKLIVKSVLSDSFTLNETSVFLLGSVRSVLPVAAIPAFEHMVNINNAISSRKNYAAFFHLLSYESCIDAVIPLKVTPILQQCLELEKLELLPSVTNVVEMGDQMRFYNKEASDLLHPKNSRNSLPQKHYFYCNTTVNQCSKYINLMCPRMKCSQNLKRATLPSWAGLIISRNIDAKSVRLEGLVLIEIGRRILILTTPLEICAQKNFCNSVTEACRIFSCGFAPSTAIAMVSTLFQQQKIGTTQQPLCTRILKQHQM